MQHGIYYAYWEHEWDGDYHYYIDKVAKLGYDILEIAAGPLPEYSDGDLKALKEHAKEQNIRLTVGYGPAPENNIASSDPQVRKHALAFYTDLFQRMEKSGQLSLVGRSIPAGRLIIRNRLTRRGIGSAELKAWQNLAKLLRNVVLKCLDLSV